MKKQCLIYNVLLINNAVIWLILREGGRMVRKKIEIKKIVDKAARQVAFSKRRKGLFKKAKELSTLCDADIALLVFSASGKLFDYASSRFLSLSLSPPLTYFIKIENQCSSYNQQFMHDAFFETPYFFILLRSGMAFFKVFIFLILLWLDEAGAQKSLDYAFIHIVRLQLWLN